MRVFFTSVPLSIKSCFFFHCAWYRSDVNPLWPTQLTSLNLRFIPHWNILSLPFLSPFATHSVNNWIRFSCTVGVVARAESLESTINILLHVHDVVKPYIFLLELSINSDVIRFSGFIFCTTKSRAFSIYINVETDHLSQSCVMFEIAVSIELTVLAWFWFSRRYLCWVDNVSSWNDGRNLKTKLLVENSKSKDYKNIKAHFLI